MSPVAPKFTQRAPIPDRLQDLLVREAAFLLSRERISAALRMAKEQKSAEGGRPLLSFLFKDSKKESQRREIVENVSVLEAGISKINASLPKLEACVGRSLENYLREYDLEYVNGLASSRFFDDWHRLLARFDETIVTFINQLKELKGAFEPLPAAEPCGSNPAIRQSIESAVATAQALQDEISFVNRIADAQRIRAGTEAITLYRQPERNWVGTALSLILTMPGPAIATVTLLLNESHEIGGHVRSAIQGECQLASYVAQYGVTSYHQRVWASLREAATVSIGPDTLETTLADTEEKMDVGLLIPWTPPRAEPGVASEKVAQPPPVPAPPPAALLARKPPKPAIPAPPPPGMKLGSPQEVPLSLRSRNPENHPGHGTPSGQPPPTVEPATATASISAPAATAKSMGDALPKEAADTVADLAAERIRLEEILKEERQGLEQRAQYLSQSEERLLQKTQEQIERETELEQREEQLRDLERRLREKLGPGEMPFALSATAVAAPAQPFDEFRE